MEIKAGSFVGGLSVGFAGSDHLFQQMLDPSASKSQGFQMHCNYLLWIQYFNGCNYALHLSVNTDT
jgi:hypothetical protein